MNNENYQSEVHHNEVTKLVSNTGRSVPIEIDFNKIPEGMLDFYFSELSILSKDLSLNNGNINFEERLNIIINKYNGSTPPFIDKILYDLTTTSICSSKKENISNIKSTIGLFLKVKTDKENESYKEELKEELKDKILKLKYAIDRIFSLKEEIKNKKLELELKDRKLESKDKILESEEKRNSGLKEGIFGLTKNFQGQISDLKDKNIDLEGRNKVYECGFKMLENMFLEEKARVEAQSICIQEEIKNFMERRKYM